MTPGQLRRKANRVLDLNHDEFVLAEATKTIDIYFVRSAYDIVSHNVKRVYYFYQSLYKYPVIVVMGILAYWYANLWLLFGIVICWIGAFAERRNYNLVFLYILFCIGVWMREGFSFRQYITIYLFCLLSGWVFSKAARNAIEDNLRNAMTYSASFYYLLKQGYNFIILAKPAYYVMRDKADKTSEN